MKVVFGAFGFEFGGLEVGLARKAVLTKLLLAAIGGVLLPGRVRIAFPWRRGARIISIRFQI